MTPSQSTDDLVKRLMRWVKHRPFMYAEPHTAEPPMQVDVAESIDTIKRLQGELAARDKTIETLKNELDASTLLRKGYATLIDQLEADLKKYGRHTMACMKLDYHDERDHGCTCGFEAAIELIDAARSEVKP